MATVTTQDNSLSFLTSTLGGFVSEAAVKAPVLSQRVGSIADILYTAVDYGYVSFASDTRIVLETSYPEPSTLTISGRGFTGNSATISRMELINNNNLYMLMRGALRVSAAGDISGSLSQISVTDWEQTVSYVGSMSFTTGVARYSSMTYALSTEAGTLNAERFLLSYGGSFIEGEDGLVRGTVTSIVFQRDPDGDSPIAPQTLLSLGGLSRYSEFDIESGRPFGFLAASTTEYFTSLLAGADSVVGGTGDDTLYGYQGNDALNGGLGMDAMHGGVGDDSYVVDNAGDTVVELADEGTDTVTASVSYTLADHVERLTLSGTALVATGNELDNTLTGNASANVLRGLGGADVLDGGAGADTLEGGEGDDLYVLDQTGDAVLEAADEGTDTVRVLFGHKARAAVTLSLDSAYANVENLEVLGAGLYNLVGNASANMLIGNASANVIDGGAGADRMEGGLGNDSYVVDDADDVVVETAVRGSGVDLVRARVDYVLGANVENLTLEGTAVRGEGNALGNVLTGSELDNALYGAEGNDVLSGGLGNDLLDGGAGIDSMSGGAGDDTYVVDNVRDGVSEGLNAGTDTVRASISYALGLNVENLVLEGAALNGTGNALANRITGNALNNLLDGGVGADTLIGGEGDDSYVVDNVGDVITEAADEGLDSVRFTLSNSAINALDLDLGADYAHVENATLAGVGRINLAGSAADNMLTGNASANVLRGLGGADVLDGGAGADTLEGGEGDDLYVLDQTGDAVLEAADEGTDTVRVLFGHKARAAVTLSLDSAYANVENLEVLGAGLYNLVGNASANVLIGNASANVIDGGAGADRMEGGLGNDSYVVDDADDVVVETAVRGSGVDLVRARVDYVLGANVENLTLEGAAVRGEGNALGNVLTGSELDNALYGAEGNDVLSGGLGNDLLDGGVGIDSMSGGEGDDTYVVDNARDGVSEGLNAGTDTVRASISYALGLNVENLVLEGAALNGTGNALTNRITGNALNNLLDGGAGADTLIGGEGDDSYVVDNVGDVITEAADEGTDSVRFTLSNSAVSALDLDLGADYANVENATLAGVGRINLAGSTADNTLTGNASANVLRGLGGADVLDGGAGADTLEGGEGDDLYVLDQSGDAVLEAADEGTDTVRVLFGHKARAAVTLSLDSAYANVENLEVLGAGLYNLVGNASANVLIGNGSANVIDGGAGADRMEGGLGNDSYVVDDADDVVVETAVRGSGVDLVRARVDYVLGANVENLTLEGAAVRGEGNALGNVLTGSELDNALYGAEGNDVLSGGLGNDLLDGGVGIDSMSGGEGDDTYVVDNVRDGVSEGLNAGTDTVRVSFNYTLGAHLENLEFIGSGAFTGTGNALDNVITGGSGADKLYGGLGNDRLIGGLGDDELHGGAGADTLIGGYGTDRYYGLTYDDEIVEDVDSTLLHTEGGFDFAYFSIVHTNAAMPLTVSVAMKYQNVEWLDFTGSTGRIDVIGTSGSDNILGNASNNVLYGEGGHDYLFGGAGADVTVGGDGNDRHSVDSLQDQVIELADGGRDEVTVFMANSTNTALEVSYSNVEEITLYHSTGLINATLTTRAGEYGTLTGNASANVLRGSASHDFIDGGFGNDTMIGGEGDDNYLIHDRGDRVVEQAGAGRDSVQISYNDLSGQQISFTFEHIEAVTMLYTIGLFNVTTLSDDRRVLHGNDSANRLTTGNGDDELKGEGGSDRLVAGGGNDVLYGGNDTVADDLFGGSGDDLYYVWGTADRVFEDADAGVDTVAIVSVQGNQPFSFSNVEVIRVHATTGAIVNGSAGNERIFGGDGADTLSGGGGNDLIGGGKGLNLLAGGDGEDAFYFGVAPQVGTLSTVSDFDVVQDRFVLKASAFSALSGSFNDGETALDAAAFQSGSGSDALGATVRIVHNTTTGALYYDADGSGAGAAVQFAQIGSGLSLDADHFFITTA